MSWTDWLLFWTPSKVLLLLLLLFFSAFSASSETALFSLNRFQLRRIKENHDSAYKRIRVLLSRPSRILTLLILLNEFVNLSITNIITSSLQHSYELPLETSEHYTRAMTTVVLLSIAITVPITLLLGEITPKVLATKMNRIIAIVNSKYLIVFYKILFPILWIVDGAISFMLRKFKSSGKDYLSKANSILSEEDFVILLEQGHSEGTVDPSERTLIKNVFEFDDNTASEVMTPISKAFTISASSKITDVLPSILSANYSRVPVYSKRAKNIVGVFYLKDLLPLKLKEQDLRKIKVEEIMEKPMIIHSNMRLSLLFKRLKESKVHMAIVKDSEHAIGVVTMEDVLKSIFGDLSKDSEHHS